ncbi:MAG TPA: zf-HC2 domain-containing protein [Polyangiales bacterium]
MSTRCPDEEELIRFVDRDLSPEQLDGVERHLHGCAACTVQCDRLRGLIADLAAPVSSVGLAVEEHVAAVMRRLDTPPHPLAKGGRRPRVWAAGIALAAAVVLLLRWPTRTPDGGASDRLAQVSVQLFLQDAARAPFVAATRVRTGGTLGLSLRNGADRPAYVLVFAVDGAGERLWIAPRLSTPKAASSAPKPGLTLLPKSDSESLLRQLGPKIEQLATAAVRVEPGAEARLGYAVAVRPLAPGRVRVFSLVFGQPRLAGEVDLLPVGQLTVAGLQHQFPEARVRELVFELAP